MRFNSVEVDLAYADYLDSLDDWPVPETAPGDVFFSAPASADEDERTVQSPMHRSGAY